MTETAETIHRWGQETFGEPSALSLVARANLEMGELICALTDGGDAEVVRDEIADVLIVIMQVAHQCRVDPQSAVDAKMRVNRARSWARTESGRFQHT